MTYWKKIIKGKFGFADNNCRIEMYSSLPILVAFIYDDESYPIIEYIDEDNWADASSDFDKEACQYWATTKPIKMPMEE